jgi:hypothetical protein
MLCVAFAMAITAGSVVLGQTDSMVSTTTHITTDGQIQLVIQNNYTEPMTAYAYDGSYLAPGWTQPLGAGDIVDLLFRLRMGMGDPIAPGQSVTVALGGHGSTNLQISLHGAVFADGATSGEDVWVERILRQRQFEYDEINIVEKKLRDAIANGSDLDTLANQLESEGKDREARAEKNDRDQLRCIRSVWAWTQGIVKSALKQGLKRDFILDAELNSLEKSRKQLSQSLPALKENEN